MTEFHFRPSRLRIVVFGLLGAACLLLGLGSPFVAENTIATLLGITLPAGLAGLLLSGVALLAWGTHVVVNEQGLRLRISPVRTVWLPWDEVVCVTHQKFRWKTGSSGGVTDVYTIHSTQGRYRLDNLDTLQASRLAQLVADRIARPVEDLGEAEWGREGPSP